MKKVHSKTKEKALAGKSEGVKPRGRQYPVKSEAGTYLGMTNYDTG